VGSTNDLRRRLSSHQQGDVISTHGNLPALLRSYVAVASEPQARRLEHYFKSGSGKAFAMKRLFEREGIGQREHKMEHLREALLDGERSGDVGELDIHKIKSKARGGAKSGS
jgi:putative endonuclease